MDNFQKILIVVAIFGMSLGGYGIYLHSENNKKYQQVCSDMGGKPVYNGRFMECLK